MVDFLISQGRGEHAAKALPQSGGSVLDDLSFKFISFRLPPIQIQMQTVAKKLTLQLKPETSLTIPMDFKTALNR